MFKKGQNLFFFWISNVLLTYGIGALTLFEQYLSFFEQILSLPTQNEGLLIDDFLTLTKEILVISDSFRKFATRMQY